MKVSGEFKGDLLISLSDQDRTDIRKLLEDVYGESQRQFVEQLRGELRARYLTDSAATYFLLQLRGIPEFASWPSLEPSRMGPVSWVNIVAVKMVNEGGSSGVIVRGAAFLRKRAAVQPAIKASPDIELGEPELARAREAVLSLLRGLGLVRLILHGCLSGWTSQRPTWRWMRPSWWAAVAVGLAGLLLAGPVVTYDIAQRALWLILPTVALLPSTRISVGDSS